MNTYIDNSTPYPWPFDGDLADDRLALVIAGWTPDGWANTNNPVHVFDRIRELVDHVSLVVVLDHRVPRRPAVDGPSAPPMILGGQMISAAGIDGFFGGPLDAVLRAKGRDHLLLTGLGLETTVHSTMRSANDRGYECLLVADACAPLDPAGVANAVSMVEMSGGIFGAVADTRSVLAALRTTH